jgi:hypothetical protein
MQLRRKRNESERTIRLSAPNDVVYALTDVGKAGHWIPRGTIVRRDHPFVRDCPDAFEVRYRLSEEVRSDA